FRPSIRCRTKTVKMATLWNLVLNKRNSPKTTWTFKPA
ncbi:flagellar basal-body rod protein FlgB, partial [Vibrio parahaemolyticus VPTS-2010_2]